MNLKEKIQHKKITVGIIGLGYVGLPLAVEFARKGIKTIGIDTDTDKIGLLNKGKNYIDDVDSEALARVTKNGKLRAESNYDSVPECDALFICVPTPFTDNKEPDISYIIDATNGIARGLRKGHIVILKSTTFPDTTEGFIKPILDKTGLRVGKDYYLAFSPERIDPGNKVWTTANTPVIVGGVTKKCTEYATLVTKQIVSEIIRVSNPKIAEMEKLLENIFRSVNIALVNELATLCDRMGGINVWEVIEAASTKPFGFMPFYPGPGIGGHCILIDPYYLEWAARKYDFQTHFITLAAEINENMPYYVKDMILREINKLPIAMMDAKILILGVAFKRDVDDTRHSPAIRIMELLMEEGLQNLMYNDPHVPVIEVNGKRLSSVNLTPSLLASSDCVVITTDHSAYNYATIVRHSRSLIDTRNATKRVRGKKEN
ncbi:MAG: nucleotide sugar dehydrogenase, partial [Chlorobi bacterium]|nr:nucleotide sugar dehydrogenase [Chlorobiota bacterium]